MGVSVHFELISLLIKINLSLFTILHFTGPPSFLNNVQSQKGLFENIKQLSMGVAFYFLTTRGKSLWLQKDFSPTEVCGKTAFSSNPCKHFPDDFMGSVIPFVSYLCPFCKFLSF